MNSEQVSQIVGQSAGMCGVAIAFLRGIGPTKTAAREVECGRQQGTKALKDIELKLIKIY